MCSSQLFLSSLIALSWHCNPHSNKINGLHYFISSHPNIGNILLQEICSVKCNINISGYNLYQNPRTECSIAVLPYTTNTTFHNPHTAHNTTFIGLDNKGIVKFPNININFLSLYARHTTHFPVGELPQLILQNTHCFIAGDYNAHNWRWNCHSTTKRGISLHNLILHRQSNAKMSVSVQAVLWGQRCRPRSAFTPQWCKMAFKVELLENIHGVVWCRYLVNF